MANEQSKRQGERQGERQSTAMTQTAGGGEQSLAARQYHDPLSVFDSLFERMQREFFGTALLNALAPMRGAGADSDSVVRVPRLQVRDAGDALEVTAEMPGIEPDNASVQIEDDVLTISGEQRAQEQRDDARTERYVSFYRQIALPDGIDAERAQASYRNGVLTIRLPKVAQRSSARQIPVTAEQGGQQPSGQQQKTERAA
ncbi:MAG TPA: Hsp20/alpha crystallin family protein [Methylomirabilota bacterium]|jgi:HSP20 family protein|nr:Hsp20/alpha crystallin family protein [Methylomirabilota bacterium]